LGAQTSPSRRSGFDETVALDRVEPLHPAQLDRASPGQAGGGNAGVHTQDVPNSPLWCIRLTQRLTILRRPSRATSQIRFFSTALAYPVSRLFDNVLRLKSFSMEFKAVPRFARLRRFGSALNDAQILPSHSGCETLGEMSDHEFKARAAVTPVGQRALRGR